MAQWKEWGYADEYRHLGQPIHLIAVEFSKEARNLVAFEVERAAWAAGVQRVQQRFDGSILRPLPAPPRPHVHAGTEASPGDVEQNRPCRERKRK